MRNQAPQRGNHPPGHPEPDGNRNSEQQNRRKQEQRLQTGELRNQRLTPFERLLLACLLIAGIVVIKVGLKRLRRHGKNASMVLVFTSPSACSLSRRKKLIAVNRASSFGGLSASRIPRLLRNSQRLLRVVHQAVPAALGAGLFILHKPDAGAVKQIACGQQGNASQIQLALLLVRQQVLLLVALRFLKGGIEQERRGELQGGKEADNTKDTGQEAKLAGIMRCAIRR